MSQDQPTPPPEKPQPQIPESKPEVGQSESRLQQISRRLQQVWNRTQPVLRSQSIRVLRATIQLLQAVLAKLEATPPKTTSAEELSEPVQSNTTAASSESQAAPVTSSDPASRKPPDQSMPVASLKGALDKLRPRLEQLQSWWNIALTRIRSWLPESINQKFSDTALTTAIAATLVVSLWITSALLPGTPTPKVANAPTPQRNPPVPDLTAPPELSVPEKPQSIEINPPLEPVPAPSPMTISPEQQRIMDIQTQIADVGNQYANCLIQLVQTNFQAGRLTARTSNTWYDLSFSQQDRLAAELLDQTQTLNFNQLEIVDSRGTLLARSPVVGNNMVILQRQVALPELTKLRSKG